MTDPIGAELLRQVREGDRQAFDAVMGPHLEPAFRFAFGLLHDREAAEDAVQESTLKAWRKLANLRPGTDPRPWFFGIVANQCRSTVRGRWWSVLRLTAPPRPAGASPESLALSVVELRRALAQLRPEQREALVLRHYLDLPVEAVARITRVPVGTVKSRVSRAIDHIRPHLDGADPIHR